MSNVDYGYDYQYADSRLRGTTVRTKDGRPFYVKFVNEDGNVIGLDLLSGEDINIKLDKLDVSPPPLGFVNYVKHSSFIMRMPKRYYKQGVCNNNIFSKNKIHGVDQAFSKMIAGIYPSIVSCAEDIFNEEAVSRAFFRNFAFLDGDLDHMRLKFRNKVVGKCFVNTDNGSLSYKLNDKYKYIQEMLEVELDAKKQYT